ncbi:Wzz/FepE/Etk N-terminal domain-containing protein [Paucibacter sp. PLA-PC-4]|uniref:Wzz/FepE/Etk N-terminal domain-containing protein n=1 Tax=Paucibacter sp. PLA-PC-4 TaxID=2993655 RepID=UPI00224A736D|nr:Wzz/FepE/Etk N-terminal domain-containing protein [Paucibacter sp. PLA-PC-4]MCX2865141.1 Wzz/FepE/Etk N-terminal domain-containing protein [Paucibacter sp. PLA-PC-4]
MIDQPALPLFDDDEQAPSGMGTAEVLRVLRPRWRTLAGGAVAAGLLGLAISFLIPPTYTARTSFLSPQPQQNSAAAAIASLGALSGLAGAAAGVRSPADQYVALLQSTTIADRIIDQFKLLEVYDDKYRADARKELAQRMRAWAGKKDNLLTVEVDDHDPQRASDMANAFILELRKLSNGLALTEAQQRRAFFEQHLSQTRDNLANAQLTLQRSGFNPGLLKNEPKTAAETYAKVKAEVASVEIRVQTMRSVLAEAAPELQQQLANLAGLRSQLAKLEKPLDQVGGEDYVGAYREFKYQETLFEIFARQFELAKLDESREGTLFQVIDKASPPERKSKPKRLFIAIGAAATGLLLVALLLLLRHSKRGQQA